MTRSFVEEVSSPLASAGLLRCIGKRRHSLMDKTITFPPIFMRVKSVKLFKPVSVVDVRGNNFFLEFFITADEGVGVWKKIEFVSADQRYNRSYLLCSAGIFKSEFSGERSNSKDDKSTTVIRIRVNIRSKKVHLA